MKTCKNCGASLDDNLLFCTECGTPAEAGASDSPSSVPTPTPPGEPQVHCTNCGVKMPQSAPACPECGAPNEMAATGEPAAPPEQPALPEQLIHCTSCGAKMLQSAPACPECGAPNEFRNDAPEPEPIIHCTNCGAKMPQSAPACPECGAPNEIAAIVPQASPASAAAIPAANTKKWIGIAAIVVVAVLLVCLVLPNLLGGPHGYVINAFNRTTEKFSDTFTELTDNIEFLSVLKNTQDKAHTDTVVISQSGSGLPFAVPSFKTTLESDLPGKRIYAKMEVLGVAAELCADNELIGMRIPMMTGEEVYAVNTKTLGKDLKANPLFASSSMPPEIEKLSFSIFDKDFWQDALASTGDPEQYKELMDVTAKAWDKMLDNLEMEKGESAKLTLSNGDTIQCTEYTVLLTAKNQIDTLRTFMTSLLKTDFAKSNLNMDMSPAELEEDLSYIAENHKTDITIHLLIDNSGLIRSAEAVYPLKYGEVEVGSINALLLLNGNENPFDSVELIFTAVPMAGTVQPEQVLKISSKGNHTGKDNVFNDVTTITAKYEQYQFITDYNGSLLRFRATSSNAYNSTVEYSCNISASKADNTFSIRFDDLKIQKGWYDTINLAVSIDRTPGVSDSGASFFKGNPIMIPKMSIMELETLIDKVSSSPVGMILSSL